MPQLPQVETVRRFLSSVLLTPAKKIKSIHLKYPPIVKSDHQAFIDTLRDQTFTDISRYGKYLILELERHSVISHLRMEGKYHYYQTHHQMTKHEHVQFVLWGGSKLVFEDVRKFGTMVLVKKGEEMQHPSLKKLGPQANSHDFSEKYLADIIKSKNKTIKEVLLEQEIVCGIGNIYADQILFSGRVHPERQAKSLTHQELSALVSSSHYILDKAILNKGTTFRSFSADQKKGQFQQLLKVYGKNGNKCEFCGTIIKKIKVGGRGTHFCPECQIK